MRGVHAVAAYPQAMMQRRIGPLGYHIAFECGAALPPFAAAVARRRIYGYYRYYGMVACFAVLTVRV